MEDKNNMLMECRACGELISKNAKSCPCCGEPYEDNVGMGMLAMLHFFEVPCWWFTAFFTDEIMIAVCGTIATLITYLYIKGIIKAIRGE